jgi:hypothetical protein
MGSSSGGVPDVDISQLPIQSDVSKYNLRNASAALNNPEVAPPIGPSEDQAPSPFQIPPESFANPPQFSQPSPFAQLEVQPHNLQPLIDQHAQALALDNQQKGQGVLRHMLTGFLGQHGVGGYLMNSFGMPTPEQNQERQLRNVIALSRAQSEQQNAQSNAALRDIEMQRYAMDIQKSPVFDLNGQPLRDADGTVQLHPKWRAEILQKRYDQTAQQKQLTPEQQSYLDAHQQLIAQGKSPLEARQLLEKQPTIGVDQQEMNDWLAKNPGKGASDFATWKARQSPMMMVMGNMLGQGGQGTPLDQAAERYSQTGELPSGFVRSPGTTAAIIKRSAELHPDQSLAANKATFKADSTALTQLNKQFEMVSAFENTAIRNLDRLAQTAKSIPDLGARFANVPLRSLTGDMIGTENMSRLKADLLTARSESARVLNSANATGVLTNEARNEAESVLGGNLPLPAMLAAIDELKVDMRNRRVSYQGDIDILKARLGRPGASAAPSTTGGSVATQDFFSKFGGKAR